MLCLPIAGLGFHQTTATTTINYGQPTIVASSTSAPFARAEKVFLRSHHGRYLCAEPSGKVIADRAEPREWEAWHVERHGDKVTLKSHHGKYLCAQPNHQVIADRDVPREWETFTLTQSGSSWMLKSHHGKYLCAERDNHVIANRDVPREWETWQASHT